MKKLAIAAALVMAGCLLFTGCGSDSNSAKSVAEGGHTIHAVTHANWNPFEYMKDGKIVGFDIDLTKEAAKRAGYDIEITDAGWEALFEQIRGHQADLAVSGVTITPDREKSYLFSKPYFMSRQAILVKEDSGVKSAKDLMDGKTIAVQNGSTGQEALEKLMGKNNPNIKKTPMSIQMLIGGQVDALVGDDTSVQAIKAQYPDQHLAIVYDDEAFTPEYFGILYPKDSGADLKAKLDAALADMMKDGTYAKIYKTWFKEEPSQEVMEKLEK